MKFLFKRISPYRILYAVKNQTLLHNLQTENKLMKAKSIKGKPGVLLNLYTPAFYAVNNPISKNPTSNIKKIATIKESNVIILKSY